VCGLACVCVCMCVSMHVCVNLCIKYEEIHSGLNFMGCNMAVLS